MGDQQGRADLLAHSRARNSAELGVLGDPERWGGTATWEVPLTNGDQFVRSFGPQIVRVQCEDLIARAWDLSADFHIENDGIIAPGSQLGLEIRFGVGQSTGVALLLLTRGAGVSVEGQYIVAGYTGAIQLATPIPAAAMSIRPWFNGASMLPGFVTITQTATVAPRALSGGQGALRLGR